MSSVAVCCKTKIEQAGESLAPKMCLWYLYTSNSELLICLQKNCRYCWSCCRIPISVNIASRSLSGWQWLPVGLVAKFQTKSRGGQVQLSVCHFSLLRFVVLWNCRFSVSCRVRLGWQHNSVVFTILYLSVDGKVPLRCSFFLGLLEGPHFFYFLGFFCSVLTRWLRLIKAGNRLSGRRL